MPKTGISGRQQKKWTLSTIELHIRINLSTKFQLKTESFDLLDQVCPKRVFPVENRKIEHHLWILHIQISLVAEFHFKQFCKNSVLHSVLHTRISLGTKFKLKLTILIFRTKFAKKGYFWSKRKKVNTTMEFWIFKLFLAPFEFLDQICPKGVFLIKNRKLEHPHWILHIWIGLATKLQLKFTILFFWTKFSLVFPVKNGRSKHHHWTEQIM